MLEELNIADFAIIDRLTVRLAPGFNVLTGETGAGKSIIIDAVSAVLGGRTSGDMVRSGARAARIEAIFSLDAQELAGAVAAVLEGYDLLEEGENSLILAREIGAAGRSTARINGRAVPVSLLAALGELLVDIHGQSEHLSLFRVASHIELLDRYAGTLERRRRVAALVGQLRDVRAEEERLRGSRRDAARRLDLLRHQVDEITAAELRADEQEELEAERRLLANADRLAALAGAALAALSEGERGEANATDLLNRAAASVAALAHIDAAQAPLLENLQAALYGVEEVARDLSRYTGGIEADPARLAALEDRSSLLQTLARKYGGDEGIRGVLAYGERAAAEQEELLHAEDRLGELAAAAERLRTAIGEQAAALSAIRRQGADELSRRVEGQLADLHMQRARFGIALEWREDPEGVPVPAEPAPLSRPGQGDVPRLASPASAAPPGGRYACNETGLDRVEFLISPNPGEHLKPLARIASGGEASRLMLALKTILSGVDRTPTLIFDEVDTGVGGRSGQVVGEKLRHLGRGHQVICITHLPQVAALGDEHLRIEKQIVEDRTHTVVFPLEGRERVEEIAAMLGGTPVTESARQNARELLARSQTPVVPGPKEPAKTS